MTAQLDSIAPKVAGRLGQATAIEQSRAVAEVEAAIVVAMRHPRNVPAAIEAMRETCRRKELADRAFFRYKRGGGHVTGPSVHLARELARVWGNIQYGLSELRRDDEFGQSEMLAYAWDVQTNARCSSVVINPHRQYTGGKELSELRDIYENNANVGARRVREAIFAVLPAWFVEEAKDLCVQTITDGGGVPLATRIANAIEVFGNLGVTLAQLEAKIGSASGKWTDRDVAQLRVIRQSLLRGEASKDEEFPPASTVTAADLDAPAGAAKPRRPAARQPDGEATPNQDDSPGQQPARVVTAQEVNDQFKRLGFTAKDQAEVLAAAAALAGRKNPAPLGDFLPDQLTAVATALESCTERGDLVALLAEASTGQDGGTDG